MSLSKWKWFKHACPVWLKCFIGRDLAVETTCGTVYGRLIRVTPAALILLPSRANQSPARVNSISKIIVFCRQICFITVNPLIPLNGNTAE